jgi:hypothetical protein
VFISDELIKKPVELPWSNAFWPGLTPFGPLIWQAEADTELTLSASSTTAVGQKALFHGNQKPHPTNKKTD